MGPNRWLISARADFWFASAGASTGLLAAIGLIVFWGDRELDWADLVLSELHLGATYDAIIRRRLWRCMPADVLAAPCLILAVTFALVLSGHSLLVTSIAMYAAIWHRGRQSFGIARYYQKAGKGPVSAAHRWLFAGAIYLPMAAAAFLYSHLAPDNYEGEPYVALKAGATIAWSVGLIALAWVVVYVIWTKHQRQDQEVHPGETWTVLAHAVAFGSAYVLSATHASFLFVLTIHHEIQYLYFAYAVARQPNSGSEIRLAASFAVWPVIGLSGTFASGLFQAPWLAALGVGGLFCHYWLDGRIWTRRSFAKP